MNKIIDLLFGIALMAATVSVMIIAISIYRDSFNLTANNINYQCREIK